MMRFITIQPSNKYLGIFFRTCFQSLWQIKGILLYSLNWYSRPWRFAIQDPQDPCMVLCIPTYGWFHFCMLNLGKNIPVPWIHLAKSDYAIASLFSKHCTKSTVELQIGQALLRSFRTSLEIGTPGPIALSHKRFWIGNGIGGSHLGSLEFPF